MPFSHLNHCQSSDSCCFLWRAVHFFPLRLGTGIDTLENFDFSEMTNISKNQHYSDDSTAAEKSTFVKPTDTVHPTFVRATEEIGGEIYENDDFLLWPGSPPSSPLKDLGLCIVLSIYTNSNAIL
mmetsp:Transcript_11095/g.25802  ORF Transcript_11095/g.25802 Transcript_11095/m.25802 type:complete len:125 (-) Transcript_11095:21-395(-)